MLSDTNEPGGLTWQAISARLWRAEKKRQQKEYQKTLGAAKKGDPQAGPGYSWQTANARIAIRVPTLRSSGGLSTSAFEARDNIP